MRLIDGGYCKYNTYRFYISIHRLYHLPAAGAVPAFSPLQPHEEYMSLINSEVQPFKTTAYLNGEFIEVTEANLKPEHVASKESFLQFLQDERMREFNFEGLRKADLLRWGIFLDVMGNMGNTIQQDVPGAFYVAYYTNVSARDLFLPIPVSETNVNEAMEQNPGWD